jgi:dTDP-4-amino-4,6-dideoxygalactose transaminase
VHELHQAGVGAGIHYPTPLHLTPAYSFLGQGPGSHPVAEMAAREILTLPIHPHITVEQQQYVSVQLARALDQRARTSHVSSH